MQVQEKGVMELGATTHDSCGEVSSPRGFSTPKQHSLPLEPNANYMYHASHIQYTPLALYYERPPKGKLLKIAIWTNHLSMRNFFGEATYQSGGGGRGAAE